MASSGCLVNELLCFLINNFGKVPKREMISTLVGFYDDNEVVDAKQTLFHAVDDFDPNVNDAPRLKTRSNTSNKASNKRRLDCEDMFGLLEFLDKRRVLSSLPKFYAANLGRVPRVTPTEVDCVRLAETVGDLREQLCTITSQFQELKNMFISATKMDNSSSGNFADAATADPTPAESALCTFSTLMQSAEVEDRSQWFAKTNPKATKQPQRKIVGKGGATVGGKLKAVSTEGKAWHIFVGRLDPATVADDLIEFVRDAGIDVVLLEKREKWQEKYSAFRLVVDIKHKDKVFDDVM